MVADAVDGFDIGISLRLDLPTDAADGGGQGVLVHKFLVHIPQTFQEPLPGQHLAGIFAEQVQHLILHGGEGNWLSVQGGGLLREVQEQPAVVVEILCRSVVLQHGEHGADLPLQGLDGEGLGDIVHRPRLIAPELVALLVVGGEEDHHRVGVLRLNQLAQVIAAAVRQIDVQQHQIIFRPGQQIGGGFGVQGRRDLPAVGTQVIG